MIEVKCSNDKCPNPDRTFQWDESNDVAEGCRVINKYQIGADKLIVSCPNCGTDLILYVVCPPAGDDRFNNHGGSGIKWRDRITTSEEPGGGIFS